MTIFLKFLRNIVFKENCFLLNYSILNFFFKIDSITLDLDPDTNWAKIPDPNSMYLDPGHRVEGVGTSGSGVEGVAPG